MSKDSSSQHTSAVHGSIRDWNPISTLAFVLGGYLSSQLFAAILLQIFPLILGWTTIQTDQWFETTFAQFFYIAIVESIFLGLIFWFIRYVRLPLKKIGLNRLQWRYAAYALIGFGCYFVIYLISLNVLKAIAPGLDTEQRQQVGFENLNSGLDLIMVAISLVLLPPIAEEIIARGFLYGGLKQRWPIPLSAVVTSILFAAAHLQFGSGAPLLWIAAIDTFILSLVLIALRELTDSLWPAVGVHMIKNGIAFLILFVFNLS